MKATGVPIGVDVYILAAAYTLSMVLLKWGIIPQFDMLLFVVGAFIGLHLFDVLEIFINGASPNTSFSPTMLRSFITQGLIIVLTLFVLTSTSSILGRGLVLLLNLRLLYLQYQEFKKGTLGTRLQLIYRHQLQ